MRFSRLFSPRFSITLLSLTSAAWEAEAFYCLGSIIDTCRAMFHSFLHGHQSTRRADAWRTFCRYSRYVCNSLTVRQETDGAELTMTERGHVSVLDTMDGLTEIFSLLSMTILLNVIDSRHYVNPSLPLSPREEEEIILAQSEAQILVHSLTDKLSLVEDETGNDISAEKAFISYLILQGRWLLWQLRTTSYIQHNEVRSRLLTAHFLQNNDAREIFQKEEVWEEWGGEAPDCFQPVDMVLSIGFPEYPVKRKSFGNPTDQASKRQRMWGFLIISTYHYIFAAS